MAPPDMQPAEMLARAVQAHERGELEAAQAAYRAVLEHVPEQADALHLLGVIADQQGRHGEAVDLIGRAIAASPGAAMFHGNLGTALFALDRRDEAEAAYRCAVALDPGYAEGHYNLANTLRGRGAAAEARRHFETALTLQPGHAQARNNLAMLLWEDLGDQAAAARQFQILLQAAPDWATARMNHGVFRLGRRDYDEGWRDYEWRWRSETYHERDWGLGLPRWDGRPLGDAGLLVWGEQGVGDQILYGTMLADAQRLCRGRLVVAVDPRLQKLFARSLAATGAIVVPRGAPVEAGMQCPFGSLGALLRRSARDFSGKGRYLMADQVRREEFRQAYRAIAGRGQLLGLAWRSGNRSIGEHKSVPLWLLLPALQRPDVQWINLQYGDVAAELAFLEEHGVAIHHDPTVDSLRDMDVFAAQVAALDGVLSVSNTAVHVAGALGVPTRLLLPRGRGRLWYWPDEGEASLWYDQVALTRQERAGDWTAPLENLRSGLRLPSPAGLNS